LERLGVGATAALLLLHAGLHLYGVSHLLPDPQAPDPTSAPTWIYAAFCALVALGLVLRWRPAWALGMWLTMIVGTCELFSMLLTGGQRGIDRIPLAWYGSGVAWATTLSIVFALLCLLSPPTQRALKAR
jgi:hypothetical protein